MLCPIALLTGVIGLCIVDEPAPHGFASLLIGDSDPRGEVLRPPNFTLTKPGAAWDFPDHAIVKYNQTYSDYGSYKLSAIDEEPTTGKCNCSRPDGVKGTACNGVVMAENSIPLKANRQYIVAVVVRTEFPRLTTEINVGTMFVNLSGDEIDGARYGGLPSSTYSKDKLDGSGWERWEWEFITPATKRLSGGVIRINVYTACNSPMVKMLEVADIAVILKPPTPPQTFKAGEGVAFLGSGQSFGMKVLECSSTEKVLESLSARYQIINNSAIIVSQKLEYTRTVAMIIISGKHNVNFANLTRLSENEQQPSPVNPGICILANSYLTLGLQPDGLLGIVPIDNNTFTITIVNEFGGVMNRYYDDNLLTEDDYGGFTVSPYPTPGSGAFVQSTLSDNNIWFANLDAKDTNTTMETDAGWSVQWQISQGNRLFISVMPVRNYNWEESFEFSWSSCFVSDEACKPGLVNGSYFDFVNHWIMWDASAKVWAMSWKGPFLPSNETRVKEAITAIHNEGKAAVPYMSAWFHISRNANEFVNNVVEWKNKFDIDGIYSDGLPNDDWIVAYNEMRLLRDAFGDNGTLIVHDSIRESGMTASQYRPFVHTYASATLMAEEMPSTDGTAWQWPRFCTSQFRKSNAFGAIKGNSWTGKDISPPAAPVNQDLVSLIYGGRDRPTNHGYKPVYLDIKNNLRTLWETFGSDPYFYDRYYLPVSQKLTNITIGRAGMPISNVVAGPAIELTTMNSMPCEIWYTLNGKPVVPNTNNSHLYTSPINVSGPGMLNALAKVVGLELSRELHLNLVHKNYL
eukprot:m.38187 g.38187  ORF g.38187 m.38187 type:complete len:800 (-) comp9400_c0_seq1:200-2599(-)